MDSDSPTLPPGSFLQPSESGISHLGFTTPDCLSTKESYLGYIHDYLTVYHLRFPGAERLTYV